MGWFLLFVIMVTIVIAEHHRKERYVFITAAGLLAMMVIISTFVFLIAVAISYFFTNLITELKIGSLFILFGAILILCGFILYGFLKLLHRRWPFSITSLTLIEYYIQWTLIYVTIYRIVFDNLLKNLQSILKINWVMNLGSNVILVAILASLISSWIAVVLYKFSNREI